MISFNCEGCGAALSVVDDKSGKSDRCPKCGAPIVTQVRVPSTEQVTPAVREGRKPVRTTKENQDKNSAPVSTRKDKAIHFPTYTGISIYIPSGKVKMASVTYAIFIGLFASFVIGALHGAATQVNPLPYFNVFVVFGAGFAVGSACAWGGKLGKLRHFGTGMMIVLGCLFVEDAVSFWIADIVNHPFASHGLWEAVRRRAEEGYTLTMVSEIFQGNGNGHHLEGGWFLYTIEFGILFFGARLGLRLLTDDVFCEKCSRWVSVVRRMSLRLNPETLQAVLKHEKPCGDLFAAEGVNLMHLTFRQCARCKGPLYLTVVEDVAASDRAGNEKRSKSTLLQNGVVSEEVFASLLHRPPAQPAAAVAESAADAGGIAAAKNAFASQPRETVVLDFGRRSVWTGKYHDLCKIDFAADGLIVRFEAGGGEEIRMDRPTMQQAVTLPRPRDNWFGNALSSISSNNIKVLAYKGMLLVRVPIRGEDVTLEALSGRLGNTANGRPEDWRFRLVEYENAVARIIGMVGS